MDKDGSQPAVEAWVALARAHARVLAHIEAALKAENLPPLAWYDVLLELDRAGEDGLRPLDLKDRLLLPQYGISRLLDRIRAAGYLARRPCPDDRRGHIVAITPEGRAIRERAWPVYRAALTEALGQPLGTNGARDLTRLLARLATR